MNFKDINFIITIMMIRLIIGHMYFHQDDV